MNNQESNMDIDLILRSKGSSRASENGGGKNILTYEAGNKGKYLNKIEVSLTENNSKIVDLDLERKNIKQSSKVEHLLVQELNLLRQ